jgi:hypothetical protein
MKPSFLGKIGIVFLMLAALSVECAYIDPGTGSFFIQVMIAFLAGAAFAVKMFWKKIVAFFKGEKRKKATPVATRSVSRGEREARSFERASSAKHD